MIAVSVKRDSKNVVKSFELLGHAEYADPGEDIVCASVSMLVINTINSIEQFTDDHFVTEYEEETGRILCEFPSGISSDTDLLIRSMLLGLSSVEADYGSEYIKILFEEVQ